MTKNTSPELKHITAYIRTLLRDELLNGAKRVNGMDNHYVDASRNIREVKDGEPKPLAFGGNEYVIIYVDRLTRVFDTSTVPVTIEAARKAWDQVKWNHIPNDRITIGGITYVLIDSEFTDDGRIRFGYTGIKIPASKAFPQL